jgi:hypothetical protein
LKETLLHVDGINDRASEGRTLPTFVQLEAEASRQVNRRRPMATR